MISFVSLLLGQAAVADPTVLAPTPLPESTGTVQPAAFGPGSSGGGPAIVFLDKKGDVKSAELLDLYEGQIRFGLTINKTNVPAAQQVAAIVQKVTQFSPAMGSDLQKALDYITTHETFLPPGVLLASGVDLGDSYAAVKPEGSELDYVGFYQTDGTLEISTTIYNKFDTETDRAAFLIHEGIYEMARRFSQATTSADSRKFVAYLFAGVDLSAISDITPEFTWSNQFAAPVFLPGGNGPLMLELVGSSTSKYDFYVFGCADEQMHFLNEYTSPEANGPIVETSLPLELSSGTPCDAIYYEVGADGTPVDAVVPFVINLYYGNQLVGQLPNPRESDTYVPIYRD